jgi:hypothetical protein
MGRVIHLQGYLSLGKEGELNVKTLAKTLTRAAVVSGGRWGLVFYLLLLMGGVRETCGSPERIPRKLGMKVGLLSATGGGSFRLWRQPALVLLPDYGKSHSLHLLFSQPGRFWKANTGGGTEGKQ